MTKKREPNRPVMLNLFQHLVGYSLPLADASFVPAHRTGFSDALLIKFFRKEAILIVCFIFLFSALGFAQGKDVVRMVGNVMDLDVSKTKIML